MTKKKFNISSTLRKNAKVEEVELAPKIPLKKTTKDPEIVKTKVEEIHANEVKTPVAKKETTKTAPAKAAQPESAEALTPGPKPRKTKVVEKGRMVRMTIDTPEEMHLQLKIKSIQARMSMRDYVLKLIEKDLKKG
jgi:hypothetical protein